MKTQTGSKAQPKKEYVVGIRYSEDEGKRVEAVETAMALPIDIVFSKIVRLMFLTGLGALERKHKKAKRQ